MTKTLVPTSKIGTPFYSPSWRYQSVYFPERFGFEWLCSKKETDAGHLRRLMSKGIVHSSCYSIPVYLRQLLADLPTDLADVALKVWNKHYFRRNHRKISFNSTVSNSVPISWKLSEVHKLNDEFLQKLVLHLFNYQHDPYIAEVCTFIKDPENLTTKKWLSYAFYGRLSDARIAKMWCKTLGFVRALRLMLFDYSHWPTEKMVQYSLLRQLVNNGELDEVDFHIFRRVYDLGELGLKSVVGGQYTLTVAERRELELYLGSTSIDKLLNLNYSVTTAKDAVIYNKAIGDYANIGLKRLEIEQRSELLRLTTTKLAKEMGLSEDTAIFPEETSLIAEIKELSQRDANPTFASFIDIKTDLIKIEVESTS